VEVFDVRLQPFHLLTYIHSLIVIDVVSPPGPTSKTARIGQTTVMDNNMQGQNTKNFAKFLEIETRS